MSDYLTKLNNIDHDIQNEDLHQQVHEINQIVRKIHHQQILLTAPRKLGFTPDIFEDLLNKLGEDQREELRAANHLLNSFRQYLSLEFGIWSLPNLQTIQLIIEAFNVKSVLEVMAGNGYWSKAFRTYNIKTYATDSLEWAKSSTTGKRKFIQVEDLEATQAIKKYNDVDLILCSWAPNFGNADLKVVSTWSKYAKRSRLLFIGEKNGATNTNNFWNRMGFNNSKQIRKINQTFKSYDFINEKIYEIK